jgi:hypothetical protein
MLPIPIEASSFRSGSALAHALCSLPAVDDLARAWDAARGPGLFLYDPHDQSGARLSLGEGHCPNGPVSTWPACVAQPSLKDAGMSVTACQVTSGRHLLFPVFARGRLELALVTAAFDDDPSRGTEPHLIDLRRWMVRISRVLQAQLERSPLLEVRDGI